MTDAKGNLIRIRLKIGERIAHSRRMIRCGYHINFFARLLTKQQKTQSAVLKQEREKND